MEGGLPLLHQLLLFLLHLSLKILALDVEVASHIAWGSPSKPLILRIALSLGIISISPFLTCELMWRGGGIIDKAAAILVGLMLGGQVQDDLVFLRLA